MNNTLEGIHSRVTEAEGWIRDLEITDTRQNIEKIMKRNEDTVRDLWHNIKHTNICIIEGEDRERTRENT